MGVIYCKESNELVAFNFANPAMVINIYEQDNGMLVAFSDGLHDIQALQYAKRPATEVLAELKTENPFIADELFVVTPSSADAEGEDDEDEDGEDWQSQ